MNDEETVKQTFDAVWKTVIARNKKKVSSGVLTPTLFHCLLYLSTS